MGLEHEELAWVSGGKLSSLLQINVKAKNCQIHTPVHAHDPSRRAIAALGAAEVC